MMGAMKRLASLVLLMLPVVGQTPEEAYSLRLAAPAALDTNPDSALWKEAPAVFSETSAKGTKTPGHRSEFRSRWTPEDLYFLFICPYEKLNLNENPDPRRETNKLWERDVAEIFIGADFERIWQYKEFQVSPAGEWVDLDIDRKAPRPEGGWLWNSGYEVAARIDEEKKIWYGAMRIPVKSITDAAVKEGFQFRVNYYRLQGPAPRAAIAWRPTSSTGNHHVPEAFGLLTLK